MGLTMSTRPLDIILGVLCFLALALGLLITPKLARAQPQTRPIPSYCVPAAQAGELVGTATPSRTPILTDDDDDVWLVIKNETDGRAVIGFESPAVGVFCATGLKGIKKAAPPQRGA